MTFEHIIQSSEGPYVPVEAKITQKAGSTTVEHLFTEIDVPQIVVDNTHFARPQEEPAAE